MGIKIACQCGGAIETPPPVAYPQGRVPRAVLRPLSAMPAKEESQETVEVGSRLVSLPGPHDLLLSSYVDEGPEELWNGRFVVLSPKYGESKKNNILLGYGLAANGFKVLRFDHTYHVGESDGKMDLFTLPGAVADIRHAVSFVENHFEPEEIILVANSLSARCAYRAAALDRRISRLVSVVGVVNLEQTIHNIYQKDIIGEHRRGTRWGRIDILGFEIDSAHFIEALVEDDMHDLGGTLRDAEKLDRPLLHLHAEKDIWVDCGEVEEVVRRAGGELKGIKGVAHEVGENPEATRKTLEYIVRFCQAGLPGAGEEIIGAAREAIFAQNRLERNRLRSIYEVKESEASFWGRYLGKFGVIEQAEVYRAYFAKMQALLGEVRSGEVLLDAGCGNGFFGSCLMQAIGARFVGRTAAPDRFFYVGLDITPEGLGQSYERHSQMKGDLLRAETAKAAGIHYAYQRMDLNRLRKGGRSRVRLGFADNSVSRICGSLLISYLKDPVAVLEEFRRILVPGGVAVLSSMKPNSDLTVLYHGFVVGEGAAEEASEHAEKLLTAAGGIKLKEHSGIYTFFSEEEMLEVAQQAGFVKCELCRSLGNQANILRVMK